MLELYNNIDEKTGIWISNGIQEQNVILLKDQYNKDLRVRAEELSVEVFVDITNKIC